MRKILNKAPLAAVPTFVMLMTLNSLSVSAKNSLFDREFDNYDQSRNEIVRIRAGRQPARSFQKLFDGTAPHIHHRHKRNFLRRNRFGEPICLPARRIHKQLHRQGWKKFHDLHLHRNRIKVKAVARNGLIYNLTIKRCSGILLKARLEAGQYGRWFDRFNPFSHRDRYDRDYHRDQARYR